MKRIIAAAEGGEDQLNDTISNLKDDFDYAIDGLERLARQGANGRNDALMIGEDLSASLQSIINQIADNVSSQE